MPGLRSGRRRPRSGLAALLALVALAALPASASALRWSGCRDFRGLPCARVSVPLDRTGADPGRISLRVARIPTPRAGMPTLVYLSGGPGGAGVSEMLSVLSVVPELVRRYQVVGFDQRGTGRSALLRCPSVERDPRLRSSAAGEQCARRLGARRRHFTTPDSVEDLEAIRRALGVERITLFGISYGTELALEYARAHPTRVDRLIIDSVVDPDDRDPFFTVGFRAMPPTLRALCPARCAGHADPARDLASLVARLRARGALRTTRRDGRGRAHRAALRPVDLYDLMFDADYNPPLRAALPAAVRAALAGDGAPLERLVQQGGGLAQLPAPVEFSSARYAAICEETPLPWDPGTPTDRRQAETDRRAAALGPAAFYPFDAAVAAQDEIGLCLRWPDVPHPARPAPPPYPAVPTLILQGGEDLRTPPEDSAHVASLIPGSKRLVVPGVGHAVVGGDPSGCGVRALLRFVADRSVPRRCRRVRTGVPAVEAPAASFRALPARRGLPAQVGRTVSGLAETVDDLRLLLSPAFLGRSGPGLRGGTYAIRGRALVLRRFSAVPGLEVSGRAAGDTLRMTVGGRAAAHGTLRLTRGRLTGRLGGRRIAMDLAAPHAAAARALAPVVRVP